MSADRSRYSPRHLVRYGALGLFVLWLVLHLGELTGTQDGWIRFCLALVFSVMIALRRKSADAENDDAHPSAHVSVLAAVPGVACVLVGLVFRIGQMEWIGLLLILWGCLRWSMRRVAGRDLAMALLLLYWAHPLPARLFGPLQLGMQRLSVAGAEWLLVGLDVRVWADGLVLHTGFSEYEIPAWCSGMRTATTVFLLTWGLSLLNRFRPLETAVAIFASLCQALALNIIRISLLVILVPRLIPRSHAEFLHDSAGVIVIAAIFLVFIEIRLWRRLRRSPGAAPDMGDRQIVHPTDWLHLRSVRWAMVAGGVLAMFATLAVYRNRPVRRLGVLKDVATAAHDAQHLEQALHMAQTVVARDPDDTEWQLKTVRVLLALQRYADVLTATDGMGALRENQAWERDVLRAYAYMELDRIDEAAAIVDTLPPRVRNANPRIAMILAVMALRGDDADGVARHVKLAARWQPNLERIRLMYPYLRAHREWNAIRDAEADADAPFRSPESAYAAIEAWMNLDLAPRVARITLRTAEAWPDDSRALEPFFFMTLKNPGGQWAQRFARHLARCVAVMRNMDELFDLFEKCFLLGRPDLSWLVYHRIAELDPDHPALDLSIARYGGQWFSFRRRSLGLPSPFALETIDLRAYYHAAGLFAAWRTLRDRIPHGGELAVPDVDVVRRRYLKRALAGFAERGGRGELSLTMRYLHARAREIDGDLDRCRAELAAIAIDYPEETLNVRIVLSEIYERRSAWQDVYETLRGYADEPAPALPPLLRLARAALRLRLHIAALETARVTRALYPRSAQADAMLATSLLASGVPDQAHVLLTRPRPRHIRDIDILRAQALFATERFNEADAFCRAALLPRPPLHADTRQRFRLPPAEFSSLWHEIALPSQTAFAQNAFVLSNNLDETTSPFLRDLMSLWLDAYHRESDLEPSRWLAVGRDAAEEATALNQLTLLMCRRGRYDDAREAAAAATARLPTAPLLWRWHVGLSGSDDAVIAAARRACPDDPELLLAELTTRTLRDPAGIDPLVDRLIDQDLSRFSPETIARAGDFLRRQDLGAPGERLLRDATVRADGLLPVYLLGLDCALDIRDRKWATQLTIQAIGAALRPPHTLYRRLVDLKSAEGEPDTDFDMVEALKNLRQSEPENYYWAQLLGYVRYKRGGWEILDAFNQMNAALSGGVTNRIVFGVAAEASRFLGNTERAADILRSAVSFYPDDRVLLNNLVYVLTRTPQGLAEARARLPRLLAGAADDPRILDTATAVYVADRDEQAAQEAIAATLTMVETGTPLWFRARMHAAELAARGGRAQDYEQAIETLRDALRACASLPDDDAVDASRLIAMWNDRMTEAALREPGLGSP